MNTLKLFGAAAALALSCGAVGAASAATIADHSFETPAGVGGFDYNPVVPGVVFDGDAGVAGGMFDTPPDGVQNAFLQTTDSSGAQIDLDVSGLTAGDSYSFSFFDDQRPGYGVLAYTVSFDGQALGTFSPAASGWTSRTTSVFTAGGSTGKLTFSSPLLGYDNDAGIDDITLNGGVSAAPEPGTWALMFVGFGGLGAAMRRRPRAMATAA